MRSWLLTLAAAMTTAAAPLAAQQVFFGSLHAHTSYSDGSGTPDDAYRAARAAGLDFYAITEHNHARAEGSLKKSDPRRDRVLIATNPALYRGTPAALIETADRLDDPGNFVTLYGQEFSTIKGAGGNHVNLFGAPSVITVANGRYDLLAAFVGSARDPSGLPPLVQMNHPQDPLGRNPNPNDYGRNKFGGEAGWVAAMDPLVELIEVFSGPTKDGVGNRPRPDETAYLGYLNLGFHVAPTSGQDTHFRNWGRATDTRTGVIATRLTRDEIMTALRGRRAYATDDRNLRVIFRANGALQGDILPAPAAGSPINLTLSIRDDDEPAAVYDVEVLSDLPGGAVARPVGPPVRIVGDTATPVALPPVPFTGRGQFVLLRISQNKQRPGKGFAWTAPVWFE